MSRPFNHHSAMPLPVQLLLGLVLLSLTPFAVAQSNLGELLDAGAVKMTPEEFRQNMVQRTVVGPSQAGMVIEVMYSSGGMIQGITNQVSGGGTPEAGRQGSVITSVDGVWNIDDGGEDLLELRVRKNLSSYSLPVLVQV